MPVLATMCIRARTQREQEPPRTLDRLPLHVFQVGMRLSSVSRIRTWVLARMERVWSQLAPRKQVGELAAIAVDLVRPRRELVLENAVLRHQVNVLRRGSKRRRLHLIDRLSCCWVRGGCRRGGE
jgi:hypothetical protein